MDTQDQWDRENVVAALGRVRAAQLALDEQETAAASLRAQLKAARRKITEAKWRLAEAIRLAARALGQ